MYVSYIIRPRTPALRLPHNTHFVVPSHNKLLPKTVRKQRRLVNFFLLLVTSSSFFYYSSRRCCHGSRNMPLWCWLFVLGGGGGGADGSAGRCCCRRRPVPWSWSLLSFLSPFSIISLRTILPRASRVTRSVVTCPLRFSVVSVTHSPWELRRDTVLDE